MKYIDADKLIAEIEKRAKFHDDAMKACTGLNSVAITHSAGWKEDTELLTIINSLQQEQSEVDLDADIKTEWDSFNKHVMEYDEDVVWLNWNSFVDVATHFYKLGLNTKKEE